MLHRQINPAIISPEETGAKRVLEEKASERLSDRKDLGWLS